MVRSSLRENAIKHNNERLIAPLPYQLTNLSSSKEAINASIKRDKTRRGKAFQPFPLPHRVN